MSLSHGAVWRQTRRSARVSGRCLTFRNGYFADVAQLVAHHLAKVRVAGSNPVVRSRQTTSRRIPASRTRPGRAGRGGVADPSGGVAEWLRQGPAKPCTRVRFPPPPRRTTTAHAVHTSGRLAQWESTTLTR